MKQILCILFLLLSALSFSQTNTKNYKYCREVINANEDVAVKTTFNTNIELTQDQIEQLRAGLFIKNSVYKIEMNEKHNVFVIYHLSQVSYEDLKILMSNLGIEFNFIKTEKLVNQLEKL